MSSGNLSPLVFQHERLSQLRQMSHGLGGAEFGVTLRGRRSVEESLHKVKYSHCGRYM